MRRSQWSVVASIASALFIALSATSSASAANKAAAMVIDANTGRVLHDNAGSERRYPASLTKMMTLYLVFEAVEAGRLSFSTPVTVSERAAAAAPSKLGLDAGEEISVGDAVKALIVKSANDMAIALAEKVAGTENAFAALMTKRARQIGMSDTTFRNASGLPDPDQVTTARDMLTLAMRLQDDFPDHYRLFATRSFTFGGKTYRTHNALLGRFPGVDGIKTGYTRASGFNLVSSYHAGGKHVVAAVFGGVSAGLRDAHMRMLLARAIDTASTERSRKTGPQLVADVKPAKRPQPKPVAKVSPPSDPSPPAAVAAATKSGADQGPEAGAAATAPAVAAPASAAPRISIARVKTVSVLTPDTAGVEGQPPQTAISETAATVAPPEARAAPLAASAVAVPRPDFAALKAQLAERATGEQRGAETGRAVAPPSAVADAEVSVANERGRPPSTLQAQLANLEGGDYSPFAQPVDDTKPALQAAVSGMAAPVPVPVATGVTAAAPGAETSRSITRPAAASVASGYHVQIGVYGSPAEAERAMATARTKAAHVLSNASPVALPLTKGDRQLYRARFQGFDSASATNACNELRRNGLDCFVARAN
ncbi:MAG: serine hydrolase [Deltaproteobacteria bacterium]